MKQTVDWGRTIAAFAPLTGQRMKCVAGHWMPGPWEAMELEESQSSDQWPTTNPARTTLHPCNRPDTGGRQRWGARVQSHPTQLVTPEERPYQEARHRGASGTAIERGIAQQRGSGGDSRAAGFDPLKAAEAAEQLLAGSTPPA